MKYTSRIIATLMVFVANVALPAGQDLHDNDGHGGGWTQLGKVTASHGADHDRITVSNRNDDFRKLKFKVTDAPLNMNRVVVTYDNGAPAR
jgi:hypothetical protein